MTERRGNQRQYARISVQCWVECSAPGWEQRHCQARDLSMGGLLLLIGEDEEKPPVGTKMQLDFVVAVGKKSLPLEGKVMHHTPDGACVGVEFTNLDAQAKKFLAMFIRERR